MLDLLLSVYRGKIDVNIAGTGINVKCGDLTPLSFSELSEYIRGLLSGNGEIDPARYAAVNFKGCNFIGWCISQLGKTAGSGLHS
jgi:hypothetical protein